MYVFIFTQSNDQEKITLFAEFFARRPVAIPYWVALPWPTLSSCPSVRASMSKGGGGVSNGLAVVSPCAFSAPLPCWPVDRLLSAHGRSGRAPCCQRHRGHLLLRPWRLSGQHGWVVLICCLVWSTLLTSCSTVQYHATHCHVATPSLLSPLLTCDHAGQLRLGGEMVRGRG